MIKTENYYDTDYFNLYQKKIGEFGGKANVFKFKDHILKTDSILHLWSFEFVTNKSYRI